MNWRALLDRILGTDPETTAIVDAAERVGSGLSRRQFLRGALVATAVAATVDVEQLLWMPGEKTILLPELVDGGWDDNFLPPTPDWVTRETLRLFEKNLALTSKFSCRFDKAFRVGDTVNVRIPQRFTPYDYSGKVVRPSVAVTLAKFL